MNKLILTLFVCVLMSVNLPAKESQPAAPGELSIREICYSGRLSDEEARFTVELDAEAAGKGECSARLFAGDVALLPAKLPDQLKIVRDGNGYVLVAAHPDRFKFKLELVAKIHRAEPWNQISFTGPAATIASVAAQGGGAGMEVQLLNGTLLESAKAGGVSRVKGFLGADTTVALRWSRLGGTTEVARKALLTVDSTISAQITPAVIKYTSQFHYEIVQGNAAQLTLALPATQALTRLAGEQIRDWHTTAEGNRQVLTVEFIKPIEKAYDLMLYSEQAAEGVPPGATNVFLNPPLPLDVERESGSLTLFAEDTLAEIESLTGLRQINAPDKALAAYRFNARPFMLALKLERIEPAIHVADRVSARLEETRLLVEHALTIEVEKAGIYQVELSPPPGFTVADVRGDGVEDWKVSDGSTADRKVLRVNFGARVLGSRKLDVQLEQPLKTFPGQISVAALRVTAAARETARIGTAAAPGIRLKTAQLTGLREIPVRLLPGRAEGTVAPSPDELLAYAAERPDWMLTLASERLAARIVADVFNLVTIGDGLAGGSATIRYGIVNQGVQEFKVKLPPHCRNVDFTGPNIRRKELAGQPRRSEAETGDVWTIGLQDKAWGGYTLVVTYDYPFDPKGATLPIGGLHSLDTERETGSIAVTTAASLQLRPHAVSDALRRVDETDLPAADRSLITRAVVLAYQYNGDQYDLAVEVKHFESEPILAAVADRTQITSVLTEAGEMLTQASFMVKNNEKQSQRFVLPKDATLWSCHVNGRPAKPERDGDWVLVLLPREANRDQAFAVDIVYAQKKGSLASRWTQTLELTAPRTDVPNTYAEWQLFVPPSLRLSGFGGSMNVAEGTTYQLLDAWRQFLAFYVQVLREAGGAILVIGVLAFLVITLVISSARRGWNGIITVLVVLAILAVLGAMLLPALGKAKQKAQRISSINNLKQVGLAARLFAGDNGDRLPVSFDEMMNELNTDKITYDAETGQRFTYIGAGLSLNDITPESVIAYGPVNNNRCSVLLADGSVQTLSAAKFYELNQRGLIQRAAPNEVAAQQQAAVMGGQFAPAKAPPAISGPTSSGSYSYSAGLSVASPAAVASGAAGLRSIRIELPQTGQPFLFTKVLNVGGEPLSIRARIMPLHTYQAIQMVWQVAAFLLGLVVWWWQWSRHGGAQRHSFILTLALALMLGSVGSLLIQWRALHDALIVGFPVAAVGVVAFLVWKYWPRSVKPEAAEPPPLDSTLPPVTLALALLCWLNLSGAPAFASSIQRPASNIAPASIVSASYSGTVDDRVASVEVALQFSPGKAGQTLPLFGDDVAVQQFTVKSGSAQLVRDGDGIAVRLDSRSAVVLQVRLLVKVAGDVTKRHLGFRIPPALSSQVRLVVDQPEADVDFPTAISFKRWLDKDKTRIEAVIGAGDRVELQWTPRVKRAAEVAATVFCQNTSLVSLGGGVVNVRATMDYQVTQGELRQARVQLPAGQRLLRVEGLSIRNWELKNENGTPVLVVDLIKGIPQAWRLTVEAEQVLAALPTSLPVQLPHALDVKRETGLVALQSAEELGVSVESASDLQRVDVEEFARLGLRRDEAAKASGAPAGADQTGGLLSVFRFAKPAFGLRVRAEAVQPQIEAVVRNHFRVGNEQVSLSAAIDYTIKRVGVFTLSVALPEGYRVESVEGRNVLQWIERGENDSPRRLQIALKERTSGAYGLRLELTRPANELPKQVAVAGVHPLDTAKLRGYVAVSAEPGVAIRTESFDGLTEIPVTALPDAGSARRGEVEAGSVLAYKFISPEPKSLSEWKLNVATEAVGAWVRADIVNTITLSEALVSGRALVRYDIANAPVKELRVRVPAEFRNVELTGPNIRSKEKVGRGSGDEGREQGNASDTNDVVWRVELQGKTRGFYTLTVTWEQPRASRSNTVELAGISAAGVERETGLLAIAARAPLQVGELRAADLQRVDTSDFPDWAGAPEAATVLAYRYVRPGYRLTLDARRYAEAEVLQALAENARLTTVVADDGQIMTELSLSVRNNGRQFLEVELPPGATVWSAFVAGQPVRPSRRDGRLLLPIEQSSMGDGTVSLELTYVGTNTFPHTRGQVGFISPKFDVPLKNAHWEIFLPPDYDYRDFHGTMTREVAASQASSTSFSILDYSRMEKASKASAKADVKRDVSEARRQLEGGNVREATANFNRAKGRSYSGKDEDADVKELEKKLSSAQASNLMMAQSEFALRNAGPPGAVPNAPAQLPQLGLYYDSTAAEQQWTKLQQAQEMAVAKVQPLRINLPVRGLRYAFTQVLQTETGKPMTIQLLAASTKAVSWPQRAATAMAGFLVLWGLVTLVLRVTRRQAQPTAA